MTTKIMAADVRIFEDAEALGRNTAEWLCVLALASDGKFAISCSGGSTPKRLYEVLAEPAMAQRFPWKRVHWFWGDERFVPHDHPSSNYRMVSETLLSRVAVPAGNIHAISTEGLSPQEAAAAYEKILKAFYGAQTLTPTRQLFDVTCWASARTVIPLRRFRVIPHWRKKTVGFLLSSAPNPRRASLDLSGARQQPRCGLPGDRRQQAGARRTRPLRRSRAAAAWISPVGRLHCFTDRAAVSEQR